MDLIPPCILLLFRWKQMNSSRQRHLHTQWSVYFIWRLRYLLEYWNFWNTSIKIILALKNTVYIRLPKSFQINTFCMGQIHNFVLKHWIMVAARARDYLEVERILPIWVWSLVLKIFSFTQRFHSRENLIFIPHCSFILLLTDSLETISNSL